MSLIAIDSQASWNRVASADRFIEANRGAVTACCEATTKAGKQEKCAITLPVPGK